MVDVQTVNLMFKAGREVKLNQLSIKGQVRIPCNKEFQKMDKNSVTLTTNRSWSHLAASASSTGTFSTGIRSIYRCAWTGFPYRRLSKVGGVCEYQLVSIRANIFWLGKVDEDTIPVECLSTITRLLPSAYERIEFS